MYKHIHSNKETQIKMYFNTKKKQKIYSVKKTKQNTLNKKNCTCTVYSIQKLKK